MKKNIAIAIPIKDADEYLPDLIKGLRQQSNLDYDLYGYSNGSTDGTNDFLRSHSEDFKKVWYTDKALGFVRACNFLFEQLRYDYEFVILLNQDAFPQPDWLANIFHTANHSGWAMVGSNVIEKLDEGNSYYYCKPIWFIPQYAALVRSKPTIEDTQCNFVAGTAILLKVSFFGHWGALFDERFYMYHEDVDLSIRVICAGGQIGISPKSIVVHNHQVEPMVGFWVSRNIHWVIVKNFGFRYYFKALKNIIHQVPKMSSIVSKGVHRYALLGAINGIFGSPKFFRERFSEANLSKFFGYIPQEILTELNSDRSKAEIIYHG